MRTALGIGLVLALAAASCTSSQPHIKVRAAMSSPEVEGLAEANGQLALGNVGLALEGFRSVLRDRPGDVRAAVGIAHCYEQMGRFDISRKWFETALATAPDDTAVLAALADSLQRQGKLSEAAATRAEVARLALAQAERDQAASPEAAPIIALADAAPTVTIALPPAAPAVHPDRDPEAVALADSREADAKQAGPRLERLSLGEVALITRSRPVWKGELVESTPTSATFRWVEVRPVARLLNAARVEGLAARTRDKLVARGWTKLAIGDAPATRSKTLVLYPEYRRKMALRLASQFGFTHLQSFSGSEIVVLLGRDAASREDSHAA
jgi:tetratricopeptide (TPR) repeat protein